MGALVDAGMKFVILAPHQAERVRPLVGGDWTFVSEGNIDRGRCYVYYHGGDVKRSIAVFFYDDVLARAIAFEGALTSSGGLMDRIALAAGGKRMVSVATDGETYGHHHRFGEMGLARAIEVLAPEAGFKTANFAEFLEEHSPDYQVEIKSGPNGEGTSWSCAHGVGRWYRDCGCHTGGQEDWNQAWRGPLRAALDHLRDEAAARFEEQVGEFMADPWKARDAYIELILDSHRDKEAFLDRFCERQLKERERVRALSLLDMQHNALLMYASCGWFFNDISGLESVQVLKYAGRVMDLMEELELPSVEGSFLEILGEAQSNIAEMGNGADIYRRRVMPIRVRPRGVVAHLALSHLVLDGEESGATAGYKYHTSLTRREEHGRLRMATGRVKLESFATGRTADSACAAIHFGGVDFYCVVKPFPGPRRFRRSTERVWSSFRTASLPVILRLVQHEFGGEEYGLEHILPQGRQRISEMVFGDLIGHLSDQYARLYEENQRVIDMLQSAGFQLPVELRSAAEYTLGHRFEEEIRRQERSTDPEDYQEAIEIADEVARRNYRIDMSGAELIFSEMITDAVRLAVAKPTEKHLGTAVSLINLASRLRIEPEYDQAQEAIYELVCRGEPLSGPMRAIGLFVGLAPSLIDRAGSWPAGEGCGAASAAGGRAESE
jgi:hypothetical protein